MEELMLKLAELLDISVKGAIELYPILKEQYVWYSVMEVLFVVGILIGIAGMIFIPILWMEDLHEFIKKTAFLSVASFVIALISYVSQILLAPDLHLIMKLINGGG